MNQQPSPFWSVSALEQLQRLETTPQGLTSEEAQKRLTRFGVNLLKPKKRSDALTLLLAQFKSPIILILLFAAGLSFFLHDPADALIILMIVFVSGLLGFWQEWGAADAVGWNITFIRKFMVTFGILSSVFDYLTFGVLLFILHTTVDQFRTGWFLESVISASVIVLVIRSLRPFFQSRPGTSLLMATLLIVGVTLAFPFTPLTGLFEFRPLPFPFLAMMGLIVVLYVAASETAKRVFYKRVTF